jgi:hypothetical protein
MQTLYKQRGLSAIGWLVVAITVMFYIMLGVKLVPEYMNDGSVSGALKSTAASIDRNNATDKVIIAALSKQFDVNDVRGINAGDPNFVQITKAKNGGVDIDVTYPRTINLFKDNGLLHTIDVVITFKHHEEIR